jgi:tRNA(adenine34) deaminase
MSLALEQAALAAQNGDVPVGAIIVHNDQIIGSAYNEIEQRKDATAHAEILALQQAAKKFGNWRLNDCILCVTLEPCPMCTGAIMLSRIGTVIFGAADPARGAMGSLFDISQDKRIGPPPRVISKIKEVESLELLKQFFAKARR